MNCDTSYLSCPTLGTSSNNVDPEPLLSRARRPPTHEGPLLTNSGTASDSIESYHAARPICFVRPLAAVRCVESKRLQVITSSERRCKRVMVSASKRGWVSMAVPSRLSVLRLAGPRDVELARCRGMDLTASPARHAECVSVHSEEGPASSLVSHTEALRMNSKSFVRSTACSSCAF